MAYAPSPIAIASRCRDREPRREPRRTRDDREDAALASNTDVEHTPTKRQRRERRGNGVRQGGRDSGKRTHVVVAFVAHQEMRLECKALVVGQRAKREGGRLFPKFVVGRVVHGAAVYLLLRRSDAKRWDPARRDAHGVTSLEV